MLRHFRIDIAHMAIWSGAAVVLAALALAGPQQSTVRMRETVITAAVLVLAVGVVQATTSLLLDLAFAGPVSLLDAGNSAARFGLVWMPAVVGGVQGIGRGRIPGLAQLGPLLLGVLVAAPVWRSDLVTGLAISGLATAGSLLASLAATPARATLQSLAMPRESPRGQ